MSSEAETSSEKPATRSIREQAVAAKRAARALFHAGSAQKDAALTAIASALRASVEQIAVANERDLERARAAGLPSAMVDRLRMGAKETEATARAVEELVALPDPIGAQRELVRRPNGLIAGRQRIPLGVIAMIYEARPNVTVDAAALCVKTGNAVLLRGGKEASDTNAELGAIVQGALDAAGLPLDAVQIVPATSRDTVRELLTLSDLVDVAIPRGGEGLVRFVAEHARVPVLKHFHGVCHLFLDEGADVAMAERLALNGKVQRPSACNALECLLVHAADAARLLPPVLAALADAGVELRGCERTRALVPTVKAAAPEDFGKEFLELVLAVRVVDDLDGALDHVARYGSNHSEAICTERHASAQRWLREVDASCVLVNASTRFNDGGQLGLGAEIGISTSKLHAYGPMGLESLTTEKWVVIGEGQVRA